MTLVLLFAALLPLGAHADDTASAAATAGETISDPNTFDAWAKVQAENTATTGRIWADKTVEEDKIEFTGPLSSAEQIAVPKDKGADFLVALSALSSYSSTTSSVTKPLDVVMVLDVSGSMDDGFGEGEQYKKKINALQDAANNFITKAAEENAKITDTDKQIKISIVKFAGKKRQRNGNDTYQDGRYTYNYSQIVTNLTPCDKTGTQTLKNWVNALKPAGATRADYGLELAQNVLGNAREDANKVVIFFTDGEPNDSNGYEADIAGKAVGAAKTLKKNGVTIYSVGIFSGANASKPDKTLPMSTNTCTLCPATTQMPPRQIITAV